MSRKARVALIALQKEGTSFSFGMHSIAAALAIRASVKRVWTADFALVAAALESRRSRRMRRHCDPSPGHWALRSLESYRPDLLGISAKWGSHRELESFLSL